MGLNNAKHDDPIYSNLRMLEKDEREGMSLSSDLNSESSRYYAQKLIDLDIANELNDLLEKYNARELEKSLYGELKLKTLMKAAIVMGKAFGFEADVSLLYTQSGSEVSDIKISLNQASERSDPVLRSKKEVFQFPKSLSSLSKKLFLEMEDCDALFINRRDFIRLLQLVTEELKKYNTPEESKITKVTQILERENGDEVKIVAQAMTGAGLKQSTDVYVLYRKHSSDDWKLCDNRPAEGWRDMSVDEYVKNGRSEMLQVVSPGELLKVISMIGQSAELFNQKQPEETLFFRENEDASEKTGIKA